ncbi:FecR family protein [uncultured Butyricimonas sp.]|uniref:FecR family protein n=1 Tax=uncultured Butyricimonas sp. TaxID=1268785 RepID=UPI0026DCCB1E|nr:FecR domain-containing protein [uncultured Butyricimonas sp.]
MLEYTKEYRIAQLIAKEMAGELSPEEEAELQQWQAEHSSGAKLHERILNPDNKRSRDQQFHRVNPHASWQKVEKQIAPAHKTKSRTLLWWSSAAAVAIVAITIGLFVPRYDKTQQEVLPVAEIHAGSSKAILITPEGRQISLSQQSTQQTLDLGNGIIAINNGNALEYKRQADSLNIKHKRHTIQVPKGGEYELILPDGTHVWINSDSELSFPAQFDETKREVVLSGEAYFSVTKNAAKPFIVKTNGNIEVKVLGTEFNILAYPNADVIETTLCEGSVNVSDKKQNVTLTPSHQAVYEKHSSNLTTRKVDVRLYTTWKEGLFVFENKPLEEIMTTLSRWYNINVFYVNPAVKKYHFTGDLERYGDFRKTLGMIEKATSIRFKVNGNNIIVEEVINQ